jgi:hypothetical protein
MSLAEKALEFELGERQEPSPPQIIYPNARRHRKMERPLCSPKKSPPKRAKVQSSTNQP